MFSNLKSHLKNYYLKKKFTSFICSGREDPSTMATLLYPHGKWIKKQNNNIYSMCRETCYWSFGSNVYNATVINPSGIYATVDILVRDYNHYTDRGAKFNIVEVYDINTPKEQIINDMAFKKFVFETNDFEIKKCIVLYFKPQKVGQKVTVTDFFMPEDITKQVLPVWENYKSIPYQDIQVLSTTDKTARIENNAVFIDYSFRDLKKCENKENYDYHFRPNQIKCRIQIENDDRIVCFNYFRKKNKALAQIEFLTGVTRDCERVYMRNADFEKSYHREMAKMFPSKSTELYEFNEKVVEWVNYTPIEINTENLLDFFS